MNDKIKTCPVENCRAKGGPANCRYHAGVLLYYADKVRALPANQREGSVELAEWQDYSEKMVKWYKNNKKRAAKKDEPAYDEGTPVSSDKGVKTLYDVISQSIDNPALYMELTGAVSVPPRNGVADDDLIDYGEKMIEWYKNNKNNIMNDALNYNEIIDFSEKMMEWYKNTKEDALNNELVDYGEKMMEWYKNNKNNMKDALDYNEIIDFSEKMMEWYENNKKRYGEEDYKRDMELVMKNNPDIDYSPWNLGTLESVSESEPDVQSWRYDTVYDDMDKWSKFDVKDGFQRSVDWDFLKGLDYQKGIGVVNYAVWSDDNEDDKEHSRKVEEAIQAMSPSEIYEALRTDLATRDKILIATDRMFAFYYYNDTGTDFNMPRVIASANRKLCDEIDMLQAYYYEKTDGDLGGIKLDHMNDILAGIRKTYHKSGSNIMGSCMPSWEGENIVCGVDIETTSLNPLCGYITDIGIEYQDMSPVQSILGEQRDIYLNSGKNYNCGASFGQTRKVYGTSGVRDNIGVTEVARGTSDSDYERCMEAKKNALHASDETRPMGVVGGLTTKDLRDCPTFEDSPKSQMQILKHFTSGVPYVAHNARFEHDWFTWHLNGYAEAFKAGKIRIIDTRKIAQSKTTKEDLEAYKATHNGKSRGLHSLEYIAKERGFLTDSQHEQHRGLEDAKLMNDVMYDFLNNDD